MYNLATKAIYFPSSNRGKADYGWLKTSYSFSFGQYYNPNNLNFGALRVLNDDVIGAGAGFDTHPHDNMEIITIPLRGILSHKDSMGHVEQLNVNEVQVMSAGAGLFHSEFNGSKSEEVALFQIWILPEKYNIEPVYNQKHFDVKNCINQWQLLVAPNGCDNSQSLTINQQAYIHRVKLSENQTISYTPKPNSFGSFIMVVEGSLMYDNLTLNHRDAIGIYNAGEFSLKALTDTYIINIEVPNASL